MYIHPALASKGANNSSKQLFFVDANMVWVWRKGSETVTVNGVISYIEIVTCK